MKIYIVVSNLEHSDRGDKGDAVFIDVFKTLEEAQAKLRDCRWDCLANSNYYTGDIEETLAREKEDAMTIVDEPNEFWYDCDMEYEDISERYFIIEKEI